MEAKKLIETLFQKYMQESGLSNVPKNSVQYEETRRAFFAGFANCFLVMTEASSLFSEEKAMQIFDDIDAEIKSAFNKPPKNHN